VVGCCTNCATDAGLKFENTNKERTTDLFQVEKLAAQYGYVPQERKSFEDAYSEFLAAENRLVLFGCHDIQYFARTKTANTVLLNADHIVNVLSCLNIIFRSISHCLYIPRYKVANCFASD